jgi:pyruvyl transferase EpsO
MTLEELKRQLKDVLNYVDRTGRFVYVDYPLHGNIGDLLINQGTEAFFSDYGLNIERRYSLYDFPGDVPGMDDSVTILLHGGGNFGDIWPRHQRLREQILLRYPRNRVIILPQTVHFDDAEQERRTCAMMATYGNLHIFVRDTRSYDKLTRHGVQNISLMPDMAHQLHGRFARNARRNVDETLYFFRQDIEKSNIPIQFTMHRTSAVDWSDCIGLNEKVRFGIILALIRASRNLQFGSDLYSDWYSVRDQIVQRGVDLITSAASLVTNRLHAMLLGLFLGKPVIAFDNSYGKLSAYCKSWMRDLPSLTFVSN